VDQLVVLEGLDHEQGESTRRVRLLSRMGSPDGPGFVFESRDRLGESLVLIGDLESRREALERRFPLLSNPRSPIPSDRDRHMTTETTDGPADETSSWTTAVRVAQRGAGLGASVRRWSFIR
jgi:hypothetical protein